MTAGAAGSWNLWGRFFDHAAQRMRRGFRWLMLVWTDGQTVILADFALLTTHKAKNRQPARMGTPPKSPGSLRYEWKGQCRTLAQIYHALRSTWSRHDLRGSVVLQVRKLSPIYPLPGTTTRE
ncbi:MAG: hypothetical protein C7B43_10305 [Sulfobacillus benefaciens]|uniref:Uncharacterized protein n=1 Tax=Sulfobacillus benefaciens TaxID=453960 RepID=A0A2T2X1J7_9FIRM|nr:MAG: hypothetical protein C7B43_10305 [Sulfobacillus benefaciens]